MDGLRNSTILKYLVLVGKLDIVSLSKLIIEICCHIDTKKASHLEAIKLNKDVLLSVEKTTID